jgi:hypothetical protein
MDFGLAGARLVVQLENIIVKESINSRLPIKYIVLIHNMKTFGEMAIVTKTL